MAENDLNEDISDRDEIYIGAWFRRPDGKAYGIRSNMVAGWWGLTAPPGAEFQPPLPPDMMHLARPRC